jgi:Mg2+/Co2+ transporter CorC
MTQKELDTIKNANLDGTLADIQRVVGEKTDNFTKPSGISSKKIDMTDDITAAGITVERYKKRFGSVMRSEEDVCKSLIETINASTTSATPDKAKRIRLAKAKIAIADADRARLKMKAA